MPKHTGEPDFALIGLALLIILAFMMWQDRPIQSPRPYDSAGKHQQNPRITGHTYESWLWQDPFGFDPGDDKLHNKLHETFKISVGESHSLAEESRKNNDLCYCENGLLTQEISKISENQQGVPVKILIPSIEIKPNTVESKEFRTRYRYAVVSGLIEEGYRPSKPHPINFCTSQNNQGELQYDIRWEHFKRNDKDNLFVIWGTDKKTFKTRMTSSMHKGITIIDLPSSINTENSLLEPLINELYTHNQLLLLKS